MFVLVEPFKHIDLIDRPDLGCAMLISACKKSGIKIELLETQIRYLQYIFLDDVNQTVELIYKVCDNKEDIINITFYERLANNFSKEELTKYFRDKYNAMIINKSYQTYMNTKIVNEFAELFKNVMRLYEYYCNKGEIQISFLERLENELVSKKPSVVGFSLYSQEPFTKRLRKRIKELNIPIVVGGAFTSQLSQDDIFKFYSCDYLDYLILHSGDIALPKLINAINNSYELSEIPNLVYKQRGVFRFNKICAIKSMDELPNPDFSQFSMSKYIVPTVILPFQTARGCTWRKCSFCAHHKSYLNRYIFYSDNRLLEILNEYRKKYNCNYIAFHDEEIPPDRAERISKLIIENNIDSLNIYAYARMIHEYDKKLLALMYKAGFRTISWGLESGSDNVLQLMKKGTNSGIAKKVLDDSANIGISNICWIIFGFPGETLADAEKTVTFLQGNYLNINMVLISKFQLEKGSPIYVKLQRENTSLNDYSCYDIDSFIQKLNLKIQFGLVRITNNKFECFGYTNLSRMRLFILSSRLINLNKYNMNEMLNSNSLCPVVVGRIDIHMRIFHYYNKYSHFSNRMMKDSYVDLDEKKYEFILMAKGQKSFYEILGHFSYDGEILAFVMKLIDNESIYILTNLNFAL